VAAAVALSTFAPKTTEAALVARNQATFMLMHTPQYLGQMLFL